MSEPEYGAMGKDDVAAVARIVSLAFAGTPEESGEWLNRAGHEHVRTLREKGRIAANLLRVPMGQWFGGRSVPMVGVAAVGVSPEHRGCGAASRLMSAAIREMYEEGVALSGLYAATQPLYRRTGYEQAGHRFEIRLPLKHIDVRERQMAVREIAPEDEKFVHECYRRFARQFDGPLDRGPYVWNRVRKGRQEFSGFAALNGSGEVEGYVYLSVVRKPDRGRQELLLSDFAFSTERAGRRLISFLADFGSMADDVIFFGGPMHPALFMLREQRFRIDLRDHWMLRLVNLPLALESRGYAPGLKTSVMMNVTDSLIPENGGSWVLQIEGGRARVERAAAGKGETLSIDCAALAAMFTGYLSASQLRLLGRAQATDEVVRAWDQLFAGTTPWMSDMF